MLSASDARNILVVQTRPPQDASPGYLASLPTTDAVLAALRKAHTAKLGIMSGLSPAQHVVGAPLGVDDRASAHGLDAVSCHEMAFSSCGRYLAVCFSGRTRDRNRRSRHPSNNGVMVFDASEGYRQTAFRCASHVCPSTQWAAGQPHLSIAQNIGWVGHEPCPALEILDARTGQTVHALSPGNDSAVQSLWIVGRSHHMCRQLWSPSGKSLLLVTSVHLQDDTCRGAIVVVDMCQDQLFRSNYCAAYLDDFMSPAVWHPNSAHLVLSAGVELMDAAVFIRAGFALGVLPDHCYAHALMRKDGMCFSPDGRCFLGRCHRPDIDSGVFWAASYARTSYPLKGYCMLDCTLVGQSISFTFLWCRIGYRCHWEPDGPKVLFGLYEKHKLGMDNRWIRSADMVAGMVDVTIPKGGPTQGSESFAPSGSLVAESLCGPRILDTETGKQVWRHMDLRPQHAMIWARHNAFLPSGCGMVCMRGIAIERKGRTCNSRFTMVTEQLHVFTWA